MSDSFNPVRVELDTGIVTAAAQHGITSRWLPEQIGKRWYWIDLVEADGGRFSIWDGNEEAEAERQAEAIRSQWGITSPVVLIGREAGNVH